MDGGSQVADYSDYLEVQDIYSITYPFSDEVLETSLNHV